LANSCEFVPPPFGDPCSSIATVVFFVFLLLIVIVIAIILLSVKDDRRSIEMKYVQE
jgi:hypothetical protein